MRKTLTFAAIAATLAFMGGVAHADVYTLDVNHCTGGCTVPAGQVTVTQDGANTLQFVIQLTGLDYFNEAGAGHDAVNIDLPSTGATLSNIAYGASSSNLSTTSNLFIQDTGSINGDGAGAFNFGVVHNGQNGNFKNGPFQYMSFDVNESGLTPSGVLNLAVDVASVQATGGINTGLVGGVLAPPGSVPEPATWAMLILGVAMIGFAARRRNAAATLAA
jgi:hypothetical protein